MDDFLYDLNKEKKQSKREIISVIRSQIGPSRSFKEKLVYSIDISSNHLEKAYLTIKAASYFKVARNDIAGIAYGAELLMISALVFDDIIDEAETRSGRPSVWKKYGVAEAIILADYLASLSFKFVLEKSTNENNKILRSFIQTRMHLLEGQHLIETYDKSLDAKILDQARIAAELRCGHLIKFCLSAAPILRGKHSLELELADIGISIGKAMQIRDDIHDYKADVLGKPFLLDFMNGQPNVVTGYLVKKLKALTEIEKKFVEENWNQKLDTLKQEKIKSISIQSGAINDAVKSLNNLCDETIKKLDCLIESSEKKLLIDFVTILKG